MIIFAGLVIGGVIGALSARRNNGTRLDMLQFVAVGAIIGVVLATFASLVLARYL